MSWKFAIMASLGALLGLSVGGAYASNVLTTQTNPVVIIEQPANIVTPVETPQPEVVEETELSDEERVDPVDNVGADTPQSPTNDTEISTDLQDDQTPSNDEDWEVTEEPTPQPEGETPDPLTDITTEGLAE